MGELWTVLKLLQWTAGYFRDKGIEDGRLDAELLLADLLGLDRVGLYLQFDRPLEADELSAFRQRVRRRAAREPVQYILGRTEFWSRPLKVGPAVLIPRPDTEVLVEEALSRCPAAQTILDVGTGSGAIALALAVELPEAQLTALDLCRDALEVAAENFRENDVSERIRLLAGDLGRLPEGPFDLIVSNPPYIPAADLESLQAEVRQFEPLLALDGGPDGLGCYRLLAEQAPGRLPPGGWLMVEVGIGQAEEVYALFAAAGLVEGFIRDDYAGIARVVGARRPSGSE